MQWVWFGTIIFVVDLDGTLPHIIIMKPTSFSQEPLVMRIMHANIQLLL